MKPKDKYDELKGKYEKAKKEINKLKHILTSLKIFHSKFYDEQIKKIEEKIDKFNKGTIKEFEEISALILELGEEIDKKVERINNIKESYTFKKLYLNSNGRTQDEQFELAYNKLYDEFIQLKKRTRTLDDKTKKELEIIIKALNLTENKETQIELKFMEDSSNAEEDIKSMIYFCENFKLNNNNDNEEEEKLEILLQSIYESIKNNDIDKKKENLNKLKEKGIYDCEQKGFNVQFFNLFNNQKEEIDFLLNKSHENLEVIKDKIISIDDAVKNNDIDEVDNCIDFFNNELRNCEN